MSLICNCIFRNSYDFIYKDMYRKINREIKTGNTCQNCFPNLCVDENTDLISTDFVRNKYCLTEYLKK